MTTIIVRTKLQVSIVEELIACGFVRPPFQLITMSRANEPDIEKYARPLIKFSSSITNLSRPRSGFIKHFLVFLYILIKCKVRSEDVFTATIDSYPFALALKFVPTLEIKTFDDGSANVRQDSLYFLEESSNQPGAAGVLARVIFPKGPCFFVRQRISQHYSIYAGMPNIIDSSKVVFINPKWAAKVAERDYPLLPKSVDKILLGTIYRQASDAGYFVMCDPDLKRWIEWADIYIPHPRQRGEKEPPEVVCNYTAEVIIDFYSQNHEITVAHFGSSAVLPFINNSNVQLVDLAGTDRF